MRSGFVSAIAVLLCLMVVAMVVAREKCRLGNVRWNICAWMGIPHAGGPSTIAANAEPLTGNPMLGSEKARARTLTHKIAEETSPPDINLTANKGVRFQAWTRSCRLQSLRRVSDLHRLTGCSISAWINGVG